MTSRCGYMPGVRWIALALAIEFGLAAPAALARQRSFRPPLMDAWRLSFEIREAESKKLRLQG